MDILTSANERKHRLARGLWSFTTEPQLVGHSVPYEDKSWLSTFPIRNSIPHCYAMLYRGSVALLMAITCQSTGYLWRHKNWHHVAEVHSWLKFCDIIFVMSYISCSTSSCQVICTTIGPHICGYQYSWRYHMHDNIYYLSHIHFRVSYQGIDIITAIQCQISWSGKTDQGLCVLLVHVNIVKQLSYPI